MIIKKTKQRFQSPLYVSVVNTLVYYLMQLSCTYSVFVGEYHYQDFISFLKSENSCGFLPLNFSLDISSHLENEQSKNEDMCLAFITTVANMSAISQISNVKVKYFVFDVQYVYETSLFSCTNSNLQNVGMMLICQGKTVLGGTMCSKNSTCERKGEVCQRYLTMDPKFCIPIRHLYQTCDEYSSCDRNSECRVLGFTRTCQCMDGYIDIDRRCVISKLSLGANCINDVQCSVTNNASKCVYHRNKNNKVCSCVRGYVVSGSRCIAVGRRVFETCSNDDQCTGTYKAKNCTDLHVNNNKVCFCESGNLDFKGRCIEASRKLNKTCETSLQCTGTENANTCRGKGGTIICTCNDGFDLMDGYCLKTEKKLFESCITSQQCNGTENARNCTDDRVNNSKVCFCQDGYLEFKGICIQAKKDIYETCEMNEQCTGTENANTCRFLEGKGVCSCNMKHSLIDGKCLAVGKKLYEMCIINEQCNGTDNAGNCTNIENTTLCFCQDRYLEFQGRCIKDKRHFGDECDISLQCTGTENAGVCGKNQTCTCDEGFVRSEDGCLPEKDTLLLLIAVGGFLGIMTCSLTTSFALKRINSQTKRLECHSSSNLPVRNIRYSIVDNSAYQSTSETTAENRQSYGNVLDENIYDEAYQREGQETENVYSCSKPQFYRTKESENDIYNHLHQKPIQLSESIYGVQKPMSESKCSKTKEHKF